ncbi:MAG: hypothetical protein ACYTGL_30235 [Planctomycetota bacterium]|jgi:hypothetical protein
MDEQPKQGPRNRIQLVLEHNAGVTEHTIEAWETETGYLLQQIGLTVLSGNPKSFPASRLIEAIRLCEWTHDNQDVFAGLVAR